ncbi:MAG: 3-dehydroquinate dehydratase, partial [Desulfobacterales bacterium]|nr:3-dehydroquinate dehydratase [Desulfobacterales bacterium]
MANKRNILVIHGPNLNKLGTREPEIYGKDTLGEINEKLIKLGEKNDIDVECFQSNHEGEIVDKIQAMNHKFAGLIINPAAFTHT